MTAPQTPAQTGTYPPLTSFLPTSVKEMKLLGWDSVDIVLFTGDAYVDHPSFGAAVLGRVLQHAGYKVAIVPQPNWQDDLRDFRKFGAPRLFFGVSAGAMDSMVRREATPFGRRIHPRRTPWRTSRLCDGGLLRDTAQAVSRHPHRGRRHRGLDAPPLALRLLARPSASFAADGLRGFLHIIRHGREDPSRDCIASRCGRED